MANTQLSNAQREVRVAAIRPGPTGMLPSNGGKAQQVFDALNAGEKAWAEKNPGK